MKTALFSTATNAIMTAMTSRQALVVGSTGGVGKLLVDRLIKDYGQVTASYRKPEDKEMLQKMGAIPLELDLMNDLEDNAAFVDALSNSDDIYFTAGSGGKKVLDIDRDGAIKVGKALEKHTTKKQHLILLSSIGVNYAGKMGELEEYGNAKFEADEEIEKLLKGKGDVSLTILRPGGLTDDDCVGRILVNDDPGKTLMDSVDSKKLVNSRADVALALYEAAVVYSDGKTRIVEMVQASDEKPGHTTQEALKSVL